jgi:hypothetical protein
MRRRMLVLALALVTHCVQAHALEGEWRGQLGVGGAVVSAKPVNALLFSGLAYGLSDAFDVRGELLGAATSSGNDPWVGLNAGALWKFDVTQWVPYLGLSAGPVHHFDSSRWQASVLPTLGVDYLFNRELSCVVEYRPALLLGAEPLSVQHQLALGLELRWGY